MSIRLPLLTLLASVGMSGILPAAVPFVLPWNDASPGITDFSAMNSPIGTGAVVTVDSNGHFAANGQRVRFLGVNFAGDSPFMPTNKAEQVAARLAKFGVNCVRFHHMDASWATGGGVLAYGSSSTNINSSQLDKVHFVVSRLKAHGIYSDINLLVGREYRANDGLGSAVTTMDWKDAHILGYFHNTALALHKDYARKLLTPTNRFTGLPLARDPAVAFVEIINENGIIQKWLDGGLDRLPSAYAPALQARWNDWLTARYTNETAMLATWQAFNLPLSTNLLRNGAFSNALSYWNTEQHDTARATFSRTFDFSNAPSAQIVVTQAGSASWHIQFNQGSLPVTNGQPYTVSFWAKSSAVTNLDVSVMQHHADWLNVGYGRTVALTTNWQRFTNTFQASMSDTNVRVNFGGMGLSPGRSFWLGDVRFQYGGQLGQLPAGTSLATRTVPNLLYSGSGYTGTAEARKDWLRFLRDLENRYYDEMVAWVRTNCGYGGLVFGTIMANSPATVQSRMDVIDGHAYWQHPQFPGTAWDSFNWFQPNVSMVNTLGDDNTLAGLARQRIKGKPFTVTEYNHPQPMYFGAEAPLLLAAYGALQDWDGVWMFDYGPGQDGNATMGHVRGYFDTAQHPGKMANFLLAANLFRRGDVQPARTEITMALTPEREVDQLSRTWAWSIFSAGQMGLAGTHTFQRRINTAVGTNAVGLTNPPPAPTATALASDTGELLWDLSTAGRGYVTVNAPRTKAVLGYATNRTFTLGPVTLTPGSNLLGWGSFGLTLTRGEVFTNDCTMLLVASGWWENTGQVWKNASKDSVGTNWGRSPILMEVMPVTLTLPVPANSVSVWSLTPTGQRMAAIPVGGTSSNTIISLTTNAATIWYEIQVNRWTASYDLWRMRYFAPAEQTNLAVSGESAMPDGDGVANLLKYYLGLAGHVAAGPGQLPVGNLLRVTNELFLALTHTRDKLAADTDCVPEVSSDLVRWLSGPAQTRIEQITDEGPVERVVVRSLTPVSLSNRQYMRLRLARR